MSTHQRSHSVFTVFAISPNLSLAECGGAADLRCRVERQLTEGRIEGKERRAMCVASCAFVLAGFEPLKAQTKGGNSDAVTAITQLENDNVKTSLGNPR